MLHVFFALRRSQQPELPPPPHSTLPVCTPAFRVDLHKNPLGPSQSVDTPWLDAGAHSVIEVAVWAARTGEYRRLLARLPPPLPRQPWRRRCGRLPTAARRSGGRQRRRHHRRREAPPPRRAAEACGMPPGVRGTPRRPRRWQQGAPPRQTVGTGARATGRAAPAVARRHGRRLRVAAALAALRPQRRRPLPPPPRRGGRALKAPASAGPSRRSSSDAAWRVATRDVLSYGHRNYTDVFRLAAVTGEPV